jgi:hypothetical protein
MTYTHPTHCQEPIRRAAPSPDVGHLRAMPRVSRSTSMDAAAGCEGCFLYARRGVCPMARDAYGLQNSAEAERRAERFRAAVAQEARRTTSLPELVRRDVRLMAASARLGLRPAPASALSHDSRKDAAHVLPARPAE